MRHRNRGERPGDRAGVELAKRLVIDAGVAGLTFHPRHASQHHKGKPDYELARELVSELAPTPVIVSGGLRDPGTVARVYEQTGAAAVMLARGSLGNPWLFAQVLGARRGEPTRDEVLDELDWVIDRAAEHLGPDRAARYLRKFYPWYLARLGGDRDVQDALQRSESLDEARSILAGLRLSEAA
jgi:tRNA-dihydrouridine synthase B